MRKTQTECTTIRSARVSDVLQIVDVLRSVYNEVDTKFNFNEFHALEHIANLMCNGVNFVAERNNKVIGVLMCGYIDVAFAQTEHLETAHWYVVPEARTSRAATLLLDAVEAFADECGIVVIFHQADYHSALNGCKNNSRIVERAYRIRGYEGPLDIATVGQSGRRVGVSYRYPPRPEASEA